MSLYQRLQQLLPEKFERFMERFEAEKGEYLYGCITEEWSAGQKGRQRHYRLELADGSSYVVPRAAIAMPGHSPTVKGGNIEMPFGVGNVIRIWKSHETGQINSEIGDAVVQTWERTKGNSSQETVERFRQVLRASPAQAARWIENLTEQDRRHFCRDDMAYMLQTSEPALRTFALRLLGRNTEPRQKNSPVKAEGQTAQQAGNTSQQR